MDEYINQKRRDRSICEWPCKLYIPVPLTVKNQFAADARMYRMSQAELGAVLVMHYQDNRKILTNAVQEYRMANQQQIIEQSNRKSEDNRPALDEGSHERNE